MERYLPDNRQIAVLGGAFETSLPPAQANPGCNVMSLLYIHEHVVINDGES